MMERYYPAGYIGIDEAARRIAQARDTGIWDPAAISDEERRVWDGINVTFNGLVLYQYLPTNTPAGHHEAAYTRLLSYDRALQDLRRSLHAGDIAAEFCDENGRFFLFEKHGWGGAAAPEILLTGFADTLGQSDGGIWVRMVLLKEEDIQRIMGLPDSISTGTQSAGIVSGLAARNASRAACIAHAAAELKVNREATRGAVLISVRSVVGEVSERDFRLNIWPEARVAAGLPPAGQSGRRSAQ